MFVVILHLVVMKIPRIRDANSPVIFIPQGFGESGIAIFHSSGSSEFSGEWISLNEPSLVLNMTYKA